MAVNMPASSLAIVQPKSSLQVASSILLLLARVAIVGPAILLTATFLSQRSFVMAGAGVVLTLIALLIAFPIKNEHYHRAIRICALTVFCTVPIQGALPFFIVPRYILENMQRDQTATYAVITAKNRKDVSDNQAMISNRLASTKMAINMLASDRIRFQGAQPLSLEKGAVLTLSGKGFTAEAAGVPRQSIPVSITLQVIKATMFVPYVHEYRVKRLTGNFPGKPFSTKDWTATS